MINNTDERTSAVKYMQLWEELAYERLEGRKEGLKDGKAEGLSEGLQTGIKAFIADNLEEGIPRDRILEKLQRRFNLDYEAAVQMLGK